MVRARPREKRFSLANLPPAAQALTFEVMSPLARHLIRGLVGVAALALAFYGARTTLAALLLVPVAIVAFRGCPTCWIVGLADHLRGRTPRCGPGGCSIDR